jgi:hypothetical protein
MLLLLLLLATYQIELIIDLCCGRLSHAMTQVILQCVTALLSAAECERGFEGFAAGGFPDATKLSITSAQKAETIAQV